MKEVNMPCGMAEICQDCKAKQDSKFMRICPECGSFTLSLSGVCSNCESKKLRYN